MPLALVLVGVFLFAYRLPWLAAMPRGQPLRAGIHREASTPWNIALALLPNTRTTEPARLEYTAKVGPLQ